MPSPEAENRNPGNLYRMVVENASDVILILQGDRVCYANPAASRRLGYAPDQWPTMRWIDLVAPDDHDAARQLCAGSEGHPEMRRSELRLIGRDGQSAPFEICSSRVTYEGQPAALLIARDITERKRLTEHVVQSEKMAALGRFVSAVAHELNNPLTVIAGFAEILLMNLDLGEQDRADLEMVVSEAKRARQMVHDVLSLSREQPSQPESVDVSQLLMTTLSCYQADLQTGTIRVMPQGVPELPPVSIDPDRVGHVFRLIIDQLRELLTEASDDSALRVELTVTQPGGEKRGGSVVEIAFTSDGVKRSPDQLRQLFEPRFTTKKEDLGLGLALSYNFIAQQGGRLYAVNLPNGGIRIVIELPCYSF